MQGKKCQERHGDKPLYQFPKNRRNAHSLIHLMKVASYIEQGKIDAFELEQQECQAFRSSVSIFASLS